MRTAKFMVYPLYPDRPEEVDDLAYARLRAVYYAQKYDVPIAIKEMRWEQTAKQVVGRVLYYINSRGKVMNHLQGASIQ